MNWLLKGIDVRRTQESKWLSYKPHWTERANCIAVRFCFTLLGIMPLIFLPSLEFHHPVDRTLAGAFGAIWLAAAGYVVVRDIFQFRLKPIKTSLSATQIQRALEAFAQKEGMHVSNPAQGCLILRDPTHPSQFNDSRQVFVCVFQEGKLLVSLFQEGWRLSMPSLVWHIFIKSDFRKLLAEASGLSTTPKP
jgi:hypothetical protein